MRDPAEVLTAEPAAATTLEVPTGRATRIERVYAEILAGVVDAEQVSVDSHFFDELGADSMVMARFCARARKRGDVPAASMKDIYRHPTIRSLAAALAPAGSAAGESVRDAEPDRPAPPEPAGRAAYVLCGTLQVLYFVAYFTLAGALTTQGYEWAVRATGLAPGLLGIYLRTVVFGGAAFLVLCTLPILAKWVLIGRWTPREIRIWSLAYFRFWLVKTLIRSNPLVFYINGRSRTSASSPLFVLYLRALGAKVGRGVAIFSAPVPVCTDLLTIRDGAVVRKDSSVACYRAVAGVIQTGPVTIGRDAFVGEATVLDIDTAVGDGAQLGHASCLHTGQAVPDGERWHGSPARPTDVDHRLVGPARRGAARRTAHAIGQVVLLLGVYLPLVIGFASLLFDETPRYLAPFLDPGPMAFTAATYYRDVLLVSLALFLGFLLLGLLFVATVPRLLNLVIRPGRSYPLYGFRYWVHRTIGRLTNVKFFTTLFGDSSYIVGYLRWIGYDLSTVEQTGSNFGTEVRHETPFHVSVGRGTMVADGLSVINADFSNTSFQISPVSIGAHCFLGNRIAYVGQSRVGENCLVATKALVPMDGPVRENAGLLGSPTFEIPRSVERDSRFDLAGPDELRRKLCAKNRYNLRSMGLYLLVRWGHVFGLTLLGLGAADLYAAVGTVAVSAEAIASLLFTMAYFIVVERAVAGFRRLRPQLCSIYDPYFWWHERFWKLVIPEFDKLFSGTPVKTLICRLLGGRIGRQVFDDGCFFPERTLATVGDYATLNYGTVVQNHSQEDGTFKSDYITIGSRSTLGVGAFVHYGVTTGEGAVLAAGSFLMKGEEVPAHACWGGNPAHELRVAAVPTAGAPAPRR